MNAFDLIQEQIDRQATLPNAADIAAQEAKNELDNRLAVIARYLFSATPTVLRNVKDGNDTVEQLAKAGAVLVQTINAELAKRP